jgi:hypothetical protein
MNIIIFGMGRSGTKALQLYITYLLSRQNENEINLVYEPYLWRNRHLKFRSYEGVYYNLNDSHFVSNQQNLNKNHQMWMKRLINKEHHNVIKFIRGIGRHRAINEVLSPDISFYVIRDIHDVLASLGNMFSFYSYGANNQINYWESFKKDLISSYMFQNASKISANIKTRDEKNAFCWYVQNKLMLHYFEKSKNPNHFLIDYNDIKKSSSFFQNLILGKPWQDKVKLHEITSSFLNGDYIHSNEVLKSKGYGAKPPNDTINKVLFAANYYFRAPGKFVKDSSQNLVTWNKELELEQKTFKRAKKTHEIIGNQELIGTWNDEIMTRLQELKQDI